MTVETLPEAGPLDRVSPSRLERLRACGYSVTLSRVTGGEAQDTPWTWLGTACHGVFEDAARGTLGDGAQESFLAAFEKSWSTAMTGGERAERRSAIEAVWGPPERWPGYSLKKAFLRRRARELAAESAMWRREDVRVEEELSPPGERLFGTPDLVVHRPKPCRIVDYKTGVVTDDDGQLLDAYRRQLLLYAYLERKMPGGGEAELAIVVPLQGTRIEFVVDWSEVEREVADAYSLLDRYNAALKNPIALALPEARNCGRCPFVARCDAYWANIPEGSSAVEGFVTAVHKTTADTIDLMVDVVAGTVTPGPLHLHRFPAGENSLLAQVEVGQGLRVVGFRERDGELRTALPWGWTRSWRL